MKIYINECDETMFPSPHGDKFQRSKQGLYGAALKFPSPHGDKFQPE